MTTPEHTLVGILGSLSIGLHKRMGWPAVAFAAILSNVPDFDGLLMLVDMQRFESGHRVWGHNLLVITLSTGLLATIQFRFNAIERCGSAIRRLLPKDTPAINETTGQPSLLGLAGIGMAFQCVHLICDMTVSGGPGLSDWAVQPFWPFEQTKFVFSLIAWGDVGPTVIMMATVILIAKFGKASRYATLGLSILVAYMLCRGYARAAW